MLEIILDNSFENKVEKSTKFILGIILGVIIILILTSLYVQWTPFGLSKIDGVQGRYFIPILLLLPFILDNHFLVPSQKAPMRYILLILLFINLHAATNVILFYR